MKIIFKTAFLLTLVGIQLGFGFSLDDLGSPIQETRDKAAAELLKSYVSIPISKWEPTLEKIRKGQSKKEIMELLNPFHVTQEGGAGGGGGYSESYRLDDEWVLVCWYVQKDDTLIDRKLSQAIREVSLLPSKNFTGKWTLYFVNGRKSREINFKDGRQFGEFIAYRPDGSKCYVQHYSEKGPDGEDTGYHPSGKVSYRGQFKDGKQVGTWTWYDEAGNVISTKGFPD